MKKYFRRLNGELVPFNLGGVDFEVFSSYEEAKKSAMCWALNMGDRSHVLCDYGEIPRSAAKSNNLVFSVSVNGCVSRSIAKLYADIFQKYVI